MAKGELTVSELIEAFESNASLENIDGIAYNKNGEIIKTRTRKLIDDLDSIPFPKHEVFFDNEPNRTTGHIIASRGCPFDCSFCCLKVISQGKWQKRDIKKVFEEIKFLKTKYPRLKHIQFHDDTFIVDNERVIQFCKMIVAANLNITFECSARVKPISKEMFCWMERAGFKKIMFGLETGSGKLLKSIHKNITREDVINLFNVLKPFNFAVTTFLMCGFPGETYDTIRETIELVKRTQKIHYNWIAGIGKLWVYPETEVYQVMKEKGKISDEYWMSDKEVPYFTVEHPIEKLREFEETLMHNLSIYRIFTLKGFIGHFLSMPLTIIKFLMHSKYLIMPVIKESMRINFPKFYIELRRIYRRMKIKTQ